LFDISIKIYYIKDGHKLIHQRPEGRSLLQSLMKKLCPSGIVLLFCKRNLKS